MTLIKIFKIFSKFFKNIFNSFEKRNENLKKIDGKIIKKLRVVKLIGFSVLFIILLIQILRVLLFDFTAVSIVKI